MNRLSFAVALCLGAILLMPQSARGQAVLAEAYIASADAAREHSDLPKAARLYALALVESHGQQHAVLTAHALLGAATVHIELDELPQAEENVRAALELLEAQDHPPKDLIHMGLNCMAMITFHREEFEKSEAFYAHLLKDIEPTEANQVVRGIVLNDLALVQIALKQPEEARHLALLAAEIMHAEFGETSAHYAQCLDTLAQALHAENRLEEAEQLSLASLAICAGDVGEESPQYGSALLTLGKIQHGNGHHAESAKTTERSVTLQEAHRGATHPLVRQAKEHHSNLHQQPIHHAPDHHAPGHHTSGHHEAATEGNTIPSVEEWRMFGEITAGIEIQPEQLAHLREKWSSMPNAARQQKYAEFRAARDGKPVTHPAEPVSAQDGIANGTDRAGHGQENDEALFHAAFGNGKLSDAELKAAREHWNHLTPDQRRAVVHFLQKSLAK